MKEKNFYNIFEELLISQYNYSTADCSKMLQSKENEVINFNNDNIYINIIIPVFNRLDYLKKNIKCLLNQEYDKKYNIAITVCEIDIEKKSKSFCVENKINYIFLKSELFNKSYAMNFSAQFFQSRFYLFHDVDLLVQGGWLQKCIDTTEQQTSKGNFDFICQPIPERKIYYINKKNTEDFFKNKILEDDLYKKDDHIIQPEWYKDNFPPGGSILISSDLLYTIQGFDPILFWNYAPEDALFLERAISLSKDNKLHTWSEGPNVYHMYHAISTCNNKAREYMVFILNLLLNDKLLLKKYGIFKLQTNTLRINNSEKDNFSLKKLIS